MSYNSPFTGNVIQPTDVSFESISLSSNTQLFWPFDGDGTQTYAARIMEVSATTTSLQLWMPPANQASVGQDALIKNTGSNTFVVYDYNGQNTITSIAAGQAKYIYIETNPTTAGTWGVIAFGVGSSNVDASALAGYGLLAVGATLNQSNQVTTFSSGTTATAAMRAQTYVWTGGVGTFTLPLSTTLGNNWFMSLKNNSSSALTVACSGSDVFNGSSTVILQPNDSCMIVTDGLGSYYSVGLGKSTLFNFSQFTKNVTGGSYTLTNTEASNVIQKYTGTLTSTQTILLPPTIQVYYINNATSGSYNLVFGVQGSGGATASISANNTAIIICDSVNIINATTAILGSTSIALIDGTVSSPALTFSSDPTTGIYHPSTGVFDISILGANLFTLNAVGLTINGTGTFSGGISGGVF